MAREFFKNLPNTTTPLTAPRLNNLLDGGEAMGNIIVDSIQTKNMIPGWFYGGLDSTNGSETASTDARRTGYIDVDFTNTTNYYISGMPQSSTNIRHFICAYNSSKQFLGRTGGSLGTTENITSSVFTNGTPQGTGDVKYIRINIYSGASDSSTTNVQLEKGSSATSFVEGKALGYVAGSTENGNYIKYDDGTLIQWASTTISSISINTAWGSLYKSSSSTPFSNYPISFVGNYSLTITGISDANTKLWWVVKSQDKGASNVRGICLVSAESLSLSNARLDYVAIGRWR